MDRLPTTTERRYDSEPPSSSSSIVVPRHEDDTYAQAYRQALEAGLSTVEALQSAQQAIAQPKRDLLLTDGNPNGGPRPAPDTASSSHGPELSAKKNKFTTFRGGLLVDTATNAHRSRMSTVDRALAVSSGPSAENLRAWWETPETLRTYRVWAMLGICSFPG